MNGKNQGELHRSLKERHIRLIAMGGCIGVGLFLGSASAIRLAGPAVLLSYLIAGIFIYLIMRALGEMSVHNPVAGSFSRYANDYLGPWAGFMAGWNYWLLWIITCVAEFTAVAVYMQLWFPGTPPWMWALLSLCAMMSINFFSVKVFGEIEFWFSLIKVLAILAMIVAGALMIVFGTGNDGVPVGISNLWQHGGFMPNGYLGVLLAFQMVIFSYAGIEVIGLTAGEAKNPDKTIPAAIRSVPWRVGFFYIGALFVILSVYPWIDMGHGSPFVKTFESLGLRNAAGVLNFVVITAALSACNSGIYSTGRMVHNLSQQGHALAFFGKATVKGVPRRALILTFAILMVGVVLNYVAPSEVFGWVTSAAAVICIATWLMILFAQLKFRPRLSAQEQAAHRFLMPCWPYSNYLCVAFLVLVIGMIIYADQTRPGMLFGAGWFVVMSMLFVITSQRNGTGEQTNTQEATRYPLP
ncbi:MAG: Proline-specific permease ProY [Pseudomonas fluorescens]|nr:MAG: Proline-specific permease ProY [Pseudomonas fluorescens]